MTNTTLTAKAIFESTFVSHPFSRGDTWVPRQRAIAAVEKALARSSTSSGDVGVKALEWQKSDTWAQALCPVVTTTQVYLVNGRWDWKLGHSTCAAQRETMEEAIAEVEEERAQRIRSALTTPALAPQPSSAIELSGNSSELPKTSPTSASIQDGDDAITGGEPMLNRFHFTDEHPFLVTTAEGDRFLGRGWLAITEAEYEALTEITRHETVDFIVPAPKSALSSSPTAKAGDEGEWSDSGKVWEPSSVKVGEITDVQVEAAARALCRIRTNFSTPKRTIAWVDSKWRRFEPEARAALTAAQLSPVSAPTDAEKQSVICDALLDAFPMADKNADNYAAVAVKALASLNIVSEG